MREVFDYPPTTVALLAAGVLGLVVLWATLVFRRGSVMRTDEHSHVERRSMAVCFMDESATDDAALEYAAAGGFVSDWRLVPEFNQRWNEMLQEHRATGGLHMRALTPHGSLSHITGEQRYRLLKRAVELIDVYRIFTMAAVVNNKTYHATMPSVSSCASSVNHKTAAFHGYAVTIDFVFDDGNKFKRHVVDAHQAIQCSPEMQEYQVGALDFWR